MTKRSDLLEPEDREELVRRALDEPPPGEPWPTAEEVVAEIRRDLEKPRRGKTNGRRGD